MNKIAIAKKAVSLIIGIGTGTIVKGIIENNVAPDSPATKVSVSVAGFAIGGAVAEASSAYTDKMIDDVVDIWRKITSKNPAEEISE